MEYKYLKKSIAPTLFAGLAIGMAFSVIKDYLTVFSTLEGIVYSKREILGGDFICFYLAGKAYNLGLSPYDQNLLIRMQQEMLDPISYPNPKLVFAYPPFLLPILGFLAKFSYLESVAIWTGLSISLVILSIIFLVPKRSSMLVYPVLILAAIGFVPLSVRCLAGGQLSTIGILVWALYVGSIYRGNKFIAGISLGFGLYKPPLFAFIGLLLLMGREWRVIAGVLVSSTVLLLVSIIVLAPIGYEEYFQTIAAYYPGATLADGRSFTYPNPVGLLGLLNSQLNYSSFAFVAYASLLVLIITYFLLLGGRFLAAFSPYFLASVVITSTFLSFQVLRYDLSIFFVGIVILVASALKSDGKESTLMFIHAGMIFVAGILISNPTQESGTVFILMLALILSLSLPNRWATLETERG